MSVYLRGEGDCHLSYPGGGTADSGNPYERPCPEGAFSETPAVAGFCIHGGLCPACHRNAVCGTAAAGLAFGDGTQLSSDRTSCLSGPAGSAAAGGLGF